MKIMLPLNSLRIKGFLITALVLIALVLFFLSGFLKSHNDSKTFYHQSKWNEYAIDINRAFDNKETDSQILNLDHIYGGVVSHHVPQTIPKFV